MKNNWHLDEGLRLVRQHRNGSGWFFWIAGLSLVNIIMAIINGSWGFVFGLGTAEIIYYISRELSYELGNLVLTAGIALSLLIIGVFAILGLWSRKGKGWCFVLGFILYSLDTLLLAFLGDYMGALFHLYPLYCIFKGLQANKGLLIMAAEAEKQSSSVTDDSSEEESSEEDNLTEVQRNFRREMQSLNRDVE